MSHVWWTLGSWSAHGAALRSCGCQESRALSQAELCSEQSRKGAGSEGTHCHLHSTVSPWIETETTETDKGLHSQTDKKERKPPLTFNWPWAKEHKRKIQHLACSLGSQHNSRHEIIKILTTRDRNSIWRWTQSKNKNSCYSRHIYWGFNPVPRMPAHKKLVQQLRCLFFILWSLAESATAFYPHFTL